MKWVILTVVITGCSSAPARPTQYVDLGWAKTSLQQAQAECQDEINRPTSSGSMYLCMRAKGWEER